MALSCLSSRMCTQGSKLQCILNPLSASFWPNTRMRKRRGNPSFKIKWELQVFPLFWGWTAVELSKWRWPCLIGKAIFKTLLLFLRDESTVLQWTKNTAFIFRQSSNPVCVVKNRISVTIENISWIQGVFEKVNDLIKLGALWL